MAEWVSDLRHTFRLLAATPGFTATAIISLALGIGLNTAVLAVARAALLAPLPVEAPQDLSIAYWSAAGERRNVMQLNSSGTRDERTGKDLTSNFTYPAYTELRQIAGAGADVFAFTFLREASISLDGHAMVGGGMLVSRNYFSGLGVPMAVGRRLSEEDDPEQAEPAAVIGYTLWQRAFGGDPSAVGRTIKVNERPFTLVGVTAPRFFGVSNGGFFPPADVTLPLRAQPTVSPRWTEQWGSLFATDQVCWLRIMVRMRAGGEQRQIQEALNLRFAQHLATTRSDIKSPEIVLLPGARGLQSVRNAVEKPIYILGGVSALVFLIACINVAGLVLARGQARRREFWIRLALGAGRARIVRQAFIESDDRRCRWHHRHRDRVLGCRCVDRDAPRAAAQRDRGASRSPAASHRCGSIRHAAFVFGVLPAARLARAAGTSEFLRAGGAGATAPRFRAGRALIALQIAASIPLVVGCALFLRTVHNLARVDLGFEPRNLIIFKLDPSLNGYDEERTRRVFEMVLDRLHQLPGAHGATLIENALVSGWVSNTSMTVDGSPLRSVLINRVGPGFFETLGVPLAAGRGLSVQDRGGAARVAVVNEAAVREFFGNQNPIGRQIRMGGFIKPDPIEIVGVVRDSKSTASSGRRGQPSSFPTSRTPTCGRCSWRFARMARRQWPIGCAAVADVDRDVPVTDLKSQTAQVNETISTERMFTALLIVFALFALLLSCIGLYGVTSYAVERRMSEFGIRVALGAQRGDVLWLVLRRVMVLAIAGVALGVPAALAASRSVSAQLFGVQPMDPLSLGIGAAAMFAVTLAAGLHPARRAATLDPLVVLRRN